MSISIVIGNFFLARMQTQIIPRPNGLRSELRKLRAFNERFKEAGLISRLFRFINKHENSPLSQKNLRSFFVFRSPFSK